MERTDSMASLPGPGHASRRVCVIALALAAACTQPRVRNPRPAPASASASAPASASDPGAAPESMAAPVLATSATVAASPAIASSGAFCRRVDAQCWDCVAMAFPREMPCDRDGPACDGICVASPPGRTCRPSQRACCADGPCEQPPISGPCDAECGDPSGDGKNDRCILPESCPYKDQLANILERER